MFSLTISANLTIALMKVHLQDSASGKIFYFQSYGKILACGHFSPFNLKYHYTNAVSHAFFFRKKMQMIKLLLTKNLEYQCKEV